MKIPEFTTSSFDRYSCQQYFHARVKQKLSPWLAAGILFMLTGCGGSSSSVNYSSVNYSDYAGTIFQAIDFSRNLVAGSDPSTFVSVIASGQVDWLMPDSRSDIDTVVSSYRFFASYSDGSDIEIHVNPEFGNQASAELEANYYAEVIGRIPVVLRNGINNINGLDFLYIHKGFEPVLGYQNYIVIYTDRAAELYALGILEEVFIHQTAHVSLDLDLYNSGDWLSAQSNDGNAVSQLAHDLTAFEDVAETMLAYIAVEYRANRLSVSVEDTIRATIPYRIDYLNTRGFDMSPVVMDAPGAWDNASALPSLTQSRSLFAYYALWEQTITF